MKIRSLRFKNLNSLAGEWQVDFTHPDYGDGIFAITGPTGAGKTTILDALCLGLYGRTPRLDRVTKSSNEIMSRQTGECFAEVTFESEKGRYRCHWSQHRARKRPEGELQPARHEIVAADSGAVLESRATQVGVFIEEVTGMDFERFTRSMLLAQGGFATFLQASPDDRSPILEQITGTEIYSRISMKVHERRAAEREKLALLQAELSGLQVLSEEEESNMQAARQEKQARETALAGQAEEMRQALAWLERMGALAGELADLEKQKLVLERRRQEFGPELQKLERARQALGLEGDYRGVAALRGEQVREKAELAAAVAALPEKEQLCAAAQEAREAAETRLREARAAQTAQGEVLKKVRELDALGEEKKKQQVAKAREIKEAEEQGRGYQDRLALLEKTRQRAQQELEAIRDYLVRQAADAALPGKLAAIAGSFELLHDLEVKQGKLREELAGAGEKKETAGAACQKLEADADQASQKFAQAKEELQHLAVEIQALLKGREINHWREEAEALKERARLLLQTGETIDRLAETARTLDDLARHIEILKARQEQQAEEIKADRDKKTLLERDVAGLEKEVSLLARIRQLEEERQRLEDGRPCPLCGATDHPYARGNIPILDSAEAALQKTKRELQELAEKLGRKEAQLVKTGAEITHGEKERQEKGAGQERDEKQCAASLQLLRIEADPTARPGLVQAEYAAVQLKIAAASEVIASLEAKSKEEKLRQKDLERQRVKFDEAGKALQDARYRLATAAGEQERLGQECNQLGEEIKKFQAAAGREVEPFGIPELPLTSLATVLQDLTRRKELWQAKEEEKSIQEKKIAAWQGELEKNRALALNLEKELTARGREQEQLQEEYAALRAAREKLFGDQAPDQAEKQLVQALEQAEKALEKARSDYGQREKESSALKERIADSQGKTAKRAEELLQAERDLAGCIAQAGFLDEADYLAARLGTEDQERLTREERSLNRDMAEQEVRWQDRTAALAAEREKHLTGQPPETLQQALGECDGQLKQLRMDIGGTIRILEENEKLKARQGERRQDLDRQKQECVRWDDLHQLIGSADGKKFRNFAQGLTFEMMTIYANRQLRKMTDRYLLVRDASQPLELNVIDNYQAGEVRSTKNLSGGESFLVSLALALGLSHMASRNVRVDSLFLDEGFGTLDAEALEMAIETLAGLRQDGKLIGVISHVTALRERISTQIQVTPETGGRSTITGPGCRRI